MPLSNTKSYNTTSIDGVSAGKKMLSEDFNNFYSQFLSNDEALRDQIISANTNLQSSINQLSATLSTNLNNAVQDLEGDLSDLNMAINTSLTDLDDKIDKLHNKRTYVLPAASWVAVNNPVSQILSITGMTSADDVEVGLAIPATYTAQQARAARKAFGFITRAETGIDRITFFCVDVNKYPRVDLPIYVKGA